MYITVPMEDDTEYPNDGVLEVHHSCKRDGTVVEVGLNLIDVSGDTLKEVPVSMIDVVELTGAVRARLAICPAPARFTLATGVFPRFTIGDSCLYVGGVATYRGKEWRVGFTLALYRQNGVMTAVLESMDSRNGTIVTDDGSPVPMGAGRDILRKFAHGSALEYAEVHGVTWPCVSRDMGRIVARRRVLSELHELARMVTYKYRAMEAIEASLPTI